MDPGLADSKKWNLRCRPWPREFRQATKDEKGTYMLGMYLFRNSPSLESEKFYDNPIFDWDSWTVGFLNMCSLLRSPGVTLDHLIPNPSAVLIEALAVVNNEHTILHNTLRERK